MSAGEPLTRAFAFPLLEQLLAGSLDGLFAFDRDCRYLYWNAAMEALSGMRAPDVVGQNAFTLFPFLKEIGEDDCFRRALAGERVVSRDRPFDVPGTGRRGFFEGHYAPLYDQRRAIIGGIAVIRDITQRRRTESQLSETESRFRNMADVSPVMLWMSGTDGLCTFFNQSWLQFTGRTLEQEWGVGWAEGVHFEDFQRCMDTYLEAFNARRVFEMEYRLRRADGQYRWILDRGTPRYAQDGTFAGFIGSCIDITERRQLEGDLRAAVRMRDEFLSVASHELKTPLTSLQLRVDTLVRVSQRGGRDEPVAAARLRESLDVICQQSVRLAELVEVLLDVSRITSGHLDLKPEELDLAALANECVERWRPVAERNGSTLQARAASEVQGRWDRLRVEQVLNNLLSNAVKYGRGRPVELAVGRDLGAASFSVCDHGIGIAEADQQRIFARFERAVPTSSYGGLGLGLWIARELCEAMGGSIAVKSEPGQGATFTVRLPLTPPARSGPS